MLAPRPSRKVTERSQGIDDTDQSPRIYTFDEMVDHCRGGPALKRFDNEVVAIVLRAMQRDEERAEFDAPRVRRNRHERAGRYTRGISDAGVRDACVRDARSCSKHVL